MLGAGYTGHAGAPAVGPRQVQNPNPFGLRKKGMKLENNQATPIMFLFKTWGGPAGTHPEGVGVTSPPPRGGGPVGPKK